MSYTFVNKPTVTNDIEDIVDYYISINPELATAFLDQIEIAKKYIADFPEAFQIKYKNVKTVLLKQCVSHSLYFER